MSSLFKIDVDFPTIKNDEFYPTTNKIKLTFLQPSIYFAGCYYDYLMSRNDLRIHKKHEVEHAIQSFIDMIEKEIRLALPKDLL